MGPRRAGDPPQYSSTPPRPPDPGNLRMKLQVELEETAAGIRELHKSMASMATEQAIFQSEILNDLRQFRLERTAQLRPPPPPPPLATANPYHYQQQPPPQYSPTSLPPFPVSNPNILSRTTTLHPFAGGDGREFNELGSVSATPDDSGWSLCGEKRIECDTDEIGKGILENKIEYDQNHSTPNLNIGFSNINTFNQPLSGNTSGLGGIAGNSGQRETCCENVAEGFVNIVVNVNVDVNLNSASEGPEYVTADPNRELGLSLTQGTSIHQAKPWSAHEIEVDDGREEYHALHLFDKMTHSDGLGNAGSTIAALMTADPNRELGLSLTQGTSIHQAKPWSAHEIEVDDGREEYHALHLFDKMTHSDGLGNAGSTIAALMSIRDKGGGLATHHEIFDATHVSVEAFFQLPDKKISGIVTSKLDCKASVESKDIDSKEATKPVSEHDAIFSMFCTGPPDDFEVDDHLFDSYRMFIEPLIACYLRYIDKQPSSGRYEDSHAKVLSTILNEEKYMFVTIDNIYTALVFKYDLIGIVEVPKKWFLDAMNMNLETMIRRIKFLIPECKDCSFLWGLMQRELVSNQFYVLTKELGRALAILPVSLLKITAGILSKEFIDLGKENDILSSIGLRSSRDYEEQISKLEAVAQRQAGSGELIAVWNINNLISVVSYCKPMVLVDDDFKTTNKEEFKLLGFDEFRRSISFDLMKEPEVVASGHTHDGNFIAQWINLEHQTCPKSGHKLIHMALVPNYALKSLLHQLCEENNSLVSYSRDFVIAFGGKKVHVSKLEGKMAGLYLLSTYSPCIEFTPKLVEMDEKLKTKGKSFEIVSISINDAAEAFEQDFKNMPWFALGQNAIKTCDKLTRDSKLSTSLILVIIGADGKTVHNNVAEAIADVDGKVYDFSVIMQLVMVMEFSILSFVKNDNSSLRMEVFEKKKGYMVIGYDITHEKATVNIVKVHAKKAFDEKWVAEIARKIVMVMTNARLYTTTYTEVITGICKTLQLSKYEIRNSDGLSNGELARHFPRIESASTPMRYCSSSAISINATVLLFVALVMCVTALGVLRTREKAHIDECGEKAKKKQLVSGLDEQKLFLIILLQYGISKVGREFIYYIFCLQFLLDLVSKMLQTWAWENTEPLICFLCSYMVIIRVDDALELSSWDKDLIKENSTYELAPKYFGPFQVIARIGNVAYKLERPPTATIHPVFHVSLLTKKLGDSVITSSHLPPGFDSNKENWFPDKIVDRGLFKHGNSSVVKWLIKWKNGTEEDSTWEEADSFQLRFPDFKG